jgi:RNA polymerase sigma-70 factor, ECF subfamily
MNMISTAEGESRRGDRTAGDEPGALELFEALVRQYQEQIYRVAYRMTGNHEDAQDLVQDALIEAYESFGRFERGTHFDRWIYRIMSNTNIDKLRRRPKVQIDSLDAPVMMEDGSGVERDIADETEDPETRLMHGLLEEPLQQALDALPQEFRSVVVLSDMEGLSYEEISHTLCCPVGTVRSRLHRGRNLLRKMLGPQLRSVFQL